MNGPFGRWWLHALSAAMACVGTLGAAVMVAFGARER